jgi:hypothetical protein
MKIGSVLAAAVLFAACKPGSGTSSGGSSAAAGTVADAAAAINEQIASEGASSSINGLVPAATLANVQVSRTINCAGGGTAALSGTWVNISNSTSNPTNYRVWNVSVTHTLNNCVRRGYTINGAFTQTMDNATGGSSYMYRQHETFSPNALISSTGTYALSGSGISVTGNGISTDTAKACSLSGAVIFSREDTATAATFTIQSVSPGVTFCGNTYPFNKGREVVAAQ